MDRNRCDGVAVSDRTWRGTSGRTYHEVADEPVREGPVIGVQAARAIGSPCGTSMVGDGIMVAVRSRRSQTDAAKDRFDLESAVFTALSMNCADAPCPRLLDTSEGGKPALITEWCPSHLESWWSGECTNGSGLESLWPAVADVCKRVSDCRRHAPDLGEGGWVVPDLRPRAIMRTTQGAYRIAGFRAWGDIETPQGTESLGLNGLVSPEELFGAKGAPTEASDVWSVGCLLLVMLRMRSVIASGGRLPHAGTDAPVFVSHRISLIRDLHARKPGLFRGRLLEARQFLYPDRLPDADRRSVQSAVSRAFGSPEAVLEKHFARDICRILDRALVIDPTERYADVLELAADLDELTGKFAELSKRTDVRFEDTDNTQDITDAKGAESASQTRPFEGPVDEVTDGFAGSVDEGDKLGSWRTDNSVTLEPEGKRASAIEDTEEIPDETRSTRAGAWMLFGLCAAFGVVVGGLLIWIGASEVEGLTEVGTESLVAPSMEGPANVIDGGNIEALEAAIQAEILSMESADPDVQPAPPEPPLDPHSPDAAPAEPPGGTPPSAADNAPPAADESAPEAAPPPAPTGTTGLVTVSGAEAYLVGAAGPVSIGRVRPGEYRLFAQIGGPDQPPSQVAVVQVVAGGTYAYRCGFGVCRPR
jgi:hypothetical protein